MKSIESEALRTQYFHPSSFLLHPSLDSIKRQIQSQDVDAGVTQDYWLMAGPGGNHRLDTFRRNC
jgi:hypothetical protein